MAKALLIVPHFWDPICVPLGISSLKAYVERSGNHQVDLFDFNTIHEVFSIQKKYFEEGKCQFPYWKKWNIERNGTEMLAIHQLIYLNARNQTNYRELTVEVMNMNGLSEDKFMDMLDVAPFDNLFELLYSRVSSILDKILIESSPDIVGCHLNNSTWPGTLFILQRVKELFPHIRTVVGGPGPIMGITTNASEIETFMDAHDFIDYFVVGEGEQPFLEILDKPDMPRGIIDPQANLPLSELKKIAIKMDDLPLPDYGNLNLDRYIQLSVSSARGCPFECAFCAETLFWKGFRPHTENKTFDALNTLFARYKRTSFYLCDSLANHVISKLTSLITENAKPYTLDCYLRADATCTDTNKTKKWREGGLFRARLGMESASQRILNDMVKKTTPESMSKSLHALATQGIMTSTLWIICYPGETEEEFKTTLDFISKNRLNIYQADGWLFQYHPKVMDKDNSGSKSGGCMRFSSELNKILSVKPYVMENDMSPEERFDRLERFTSELKSLKIPNPYSIFDILSAQKRWSSMGRNSGWNISKSMMSHKTKQSVHCS